MHCGLCRSSPTSVALLRRLRTQPCPFEFFYVFLTFYYVYRISFHIYLTPSRLILIEVCSSNTFLQRSQNLILWHASNSYYRTLICNVYQVQQLSRIWPYFLWDWGVLCCAVLPSCGRSELNSAGVVSSPALLPHQSCSFLILISNLTRISFITSEQFSVHRFCRIKSILNVTLSVKSILNVTLSVKSILNVTFRVVN